MTIEARRDTVTALEQYRLHPHHFRTTRAYRALSGRSPSAQNTKSREAYENLQVPFTRRPPSSTSRRYRPQSAGSSRRNHGQDDCIKGRRFVIPTARATYPTHADVRIGRGKRASFDHRVGPPVIPPPAFSRRKDNGGGSASTRNGGDGVDRLGRARTRVRPGSANARVYERPGAGYGVGGERLGNGSSIPPKVHVPRQFFPIVRKPTVRRDTKMASHPCCAVTSYR